MQASSNLLDFVAGAQAALAFLTRIPCGRIRTSSLRWAPAWFPGVGAGLGLGAGLVSIGLARAGTLVAAAATVAMLVLVTGALHEDGLADTADALGGAFDREKLMAILKDSRIGSFGGAALILSILLRTAALARLGPLALAGLVLGQTISRTTPVWLMLALPYVTPADSSRSSTLIDVRLPQALVATLIAATVVAFLALGKVIAPSALTLALALAIVASLLCAWRFHVRAGGLTGDFLGATQQVTDVVILVALAAAT